MAKELTQATIGNAKAKSARREIPDGGCPGLYLVVQPSGAKGWAFRYRYGGKPRKLTLGSANTAKAATAASDPVIGGHLTLGDARKLAGDCRHQLAQGFNPALEQKAAKARAREGLDDRNQFDALARVFIEKYARPKNRSWREAARLLGLRYVAEEDGTERVEIVKRGVVDQWGARRVQEIARRDVIEMLDRIVEAGKSTSANRTLTVVRRLFNWLVERDVIDVSPCAGVKPPAPEVTRDRILSDDEIRWFWTACDRQGAPFGSMFKLLLLLGQRRDEVAGMTEAELQGDNWHIPSERTKNKQAHDVPLPSYAMAILEDVPRVKGEAGYVFSTTGESAISGFSRAKGRLDAAMLEIAREEAKENGADPDKAAIPHFTLHDLRRTAASGMARLGFPVHVVEAALNHKSGSIKGVAAVYNRYSYAGEKRNALEAWARHVKSLVEGSADNVVELRAEA